MGVNFLSVWTIVFTLSIASFTGGNIEGANNPVTAESTTVEKTLSSESVADQASPTMGQSELDQLAKCLTTKGAKMYGAYWCPHCADQKETFGQSFRYINYIECDPKGENPNPQACREAAIKAYPTWIMPMNKNLDGSQSAADLAEWSQCPYLS